MALVLVLLGVSVIGLGAGRFPVPSGQVVEVLARYALRPIPPDGMGERIVLFVRAPRVVLVALCGAGLAICGAALQGVFRNPLASPQLLGVSAGAAFGGATAILLGVSGLFLIGSAFAAGLSALVLVGLIARFGGRSDTNVVVLAGVVVGAFYAALVSIVQLAADPQSSLPAIVFWLMGSFAAADWPKVAAAAPVIVAGSGALWAMRYRINVLSLGDEEARSLGVPVERDSWIIFILTALVVGAAVSVAGVVGWVGLVVPHLARMTFGPDHRDLIPASCLMGAIYLSLVDTLARSLLPVEIPLGVITALLGAPLVAILLRRLQRKGLRP